MNIKIRLTTDSFILLLTTYIENAYPNSVFNDCCKSPYRNIPLKTPKSHRNEGPTSEQLSTCTYFQIYVYLDINPISYFPDNHDLYIA